MVTHNNPQPSCETDSPQAAQPSGKLVPVFGGESGLPCTALTINLALCAAQSGKSVLIIDCDRGHSFTHFGLSPKNTLDDVLKGRADIRDTKHIVADGRLTLTRGGNIDLEDMLGALAAMSLSHDWVFVIPKSGCTPAHVRLAAAADHALLMFDSAGDRFMRAYWMLDAIRSRAPKCDPLMICSGSEEEGQEAYELFAGTVRDFLGGPPRLGAIIESADMSQNQAEHILKSLTEDQLREKAA